MNSQHYEAGGWWSTIGFDLASLMQVSVHSSKHRNTSCLLACDIEVDISRN
jgi:hypothetical protein